MIATLRSVFSYVRRFFLPPKTSQKVIRLGALLLVIIVSISFSNNEVETTQELSLPPVVFTGTVMDILNTSDVSFIGTVRAVSEAQIQSEISGRVTAVYVKPGDEVSAGAILASLENASQQATLLQAEGAYEAALANAAQSEISVDDAQNVLLSSQNNAVSVYRDAYTTIRTEVLNTLDTFYGDPDSSTVPGVRIRDVDTNYLNNTRVQIERMLTDWRNSSDALTPSSDLDASLTEAQENVRLVIRLTDTLITATSKASSVDMLDGKLVTSYTSGLTATRATLNDTLSSLTGAETTLTTARENLRRAQIGGSNNSDVSLANAQVKQALGTLRSAQANYEKTVFRTPIAGTVNSMRVQTGDFISAFTQVSEVANNNALQISIYAGEADLSRFTLGGTVRINEDITGTITSIAPAIDSETQKTEIKIATESDILTNGSTVTVRLDTVEAVDETKPIIVPISAVKFNATDGFMFTVQDGKLVSVPVTIGDILGSYITITSGISLETEFVLDARGLSEGEAVEAIRK